MRKFDDAETYFLNFTTPLPNDAGGIPVGLYLVWAAGAELLSAPTQREVTRRRIQGKSAADILFDVSDGKLMAEDFNEEGAAFTEAYYERGYLADYARSFALPVATVDAVCSVPDTAASLKLLKPALDQRLAHWRANRKHATPPPKPLTADDVFAQLQRELLPELRRDGFEDMQPRDLEFEMRRRVGVIEQQILIMVMTSSSGVFVSLHVYLGAERLRRVWLKLAGRETDPPPCFGSPIRHRPDVQANEFSLGENDKGYAPYYARVPAGPEQLGRVTLLHYLEAVRPQLNALDSVAELGRLVQCPGQRRRLSNQLGYMKGPELLARMVLLAAYTQELQGRGGADLRKQLHDQVRFNIDRARDGYPDDPDVDQLLAALLAPGAVEQVRAYLDRMD